MVAKNSFLLKQIAFKSKKWAVSQENLHNASLCFVLLDWDGIGQSPNTPAIWLAGGFEML